MSSQNSLALPSSDAPARLAIGSFGRILPTPRAIAIVLPILLALLVVGLATATGARAQQPSVGSDGRGAATSSPWTGDWHTFWRGGQALMRLNQDGAVVTGTYQPGDGRIEGRAEGTRFAGTWSEEGGSGEFSFALAPDGGSFAGRFDNGEYWNGERIDRSDFSPTPFIRSDNPREAFRTILVAANAATEGDSAASLIYEPLLDYLGPRTDASDRQDRRRMLYELLDMSTFRIASLPDDPEGDRVRFTIGPAGADVTFDVWLVRKPGGVWHLEVPTEEELEAIEARIFAELGVRDYATYRFARRESPRETMRDFLTGVRSWSSGGDAVARRTMDLSGIPPALLSINAPLYADYLVQIIDRVGYVIWQEIPDDPDQQTPYVHLEHAAGDIVIGPSRDEDGNVDWRFTRETIAAAPEIYEAVQSLSLAPGVATPEPFSPYFRLREWVKDVSPVLLERGFLIAHWQWIAIVLAVTIAILAAWLSGVAVRLGWRLLPVSFVGEGEGADARRKGFVLAIRLIVIGAILYVLFGRIGLRTDLLKVIATGAALVVLVGVVALLYRCAGIVGNAFYRRAEKRRGHVDEIVSSLATGIVKIAIIVGGVFVAADIVGLPYEGVIAGLGVGGLALAIAARDTVSNFFGAAVLLADRPFKRGDFVEVDGRFAIVEDVGLRSSRLRLFDDALMVIPNGKIADGTVINYGRRRKRQILLTLAVTYDTPRARIDQFVGALKELLGRFPRADREYYVGLKKFAESGIEIDIWCYVWVTSYAQQVDAQHQLIGDIVDLAREMGVTFALPARAIHVEGDRTRRIDAFADEEQPAAAQ